MYINKQFILVAAIVATFLFKSAHADVLYTESGSDGLGNSFNVTFDWNSITTSIDSVISASFTDRTGVYELTNFSLTHNPHISDWADWKASHDWIAYDISTGSPGWLDISIGLTMTTVPTPTPIVNYGLTPYALTLGNGGVWYTYYLDSSSVSIAPAFSSVPLPHSIWLFSSALAYLGLFGQRRETA